MGGGGEAAFPGRHLGSLRHCSGLAIFSSRVTAEKSEPKHHAPTVYDADDISEFVEHINPFNGLCMVTE